jgi:hypothetical protein
MQSKRFVLRVMAALALTFVFAFAALADTRAPVNIPFEFELRGQTMPAGRYEVTTSTSSGVVSLVDPSGRQHASLTMPLGNPNKVSDSKIVFLYDGETYLLSEVWLRDAGGRKVQQEKRKPAEISKRGVERRVEIVVGD